MKTSYWNHRHMPLNKHNHTSSKIFVLACSCAPLVLHSKLILPAFGVAESAKTYCHLFLIIYCTLTPFCISLDNRPRSQSYKLQALSLSLPNRVFSRRGGAGLVEFAPFFSISALLLYTNARFDIDLSSSFKRFSMSNNHARQARIHALHQAIKERILKNIQEVKESESHSFCRH